MKTALTVLVILAAASAQALAAPESAVSAANICLTETAKAEASLGIPHRLLGAITVVETGRWDDASRASFAWPWTVTSGGEGKYFPTKAAAIAEVQRLQRRGVTNIDVGCMQINLMYHPDAFSSLEQAFDPRANVAYAAGFLKNLFKDAGVWSVATARYHSNTPVHAVRYRSKVLESLQALREGRYAESPRMVLASTDPAGERNQSFNQRTEVAALDAQASALAASVRSLVSRSETAKPPGLVRAAPVVNKAEIDRVRAKAVAEDWRAQKLADWRATRGNRAVD